VGTTDRKTASDIILKQIIIMDAAARDWSVLLHIVVGDVHDLTAWRSMPQGVCCWYETRAGQIRGKEETGGQGLALQMGIRSEATYWTGHREGAEWGVGLGPPDWELGVRPPAVRVRGKEQIGGGGG
jgi:hypothetical protein